MTDWDVILSYGVFFAGTILLVLGVLYINRDLMKPQDKRDHHTPAE